MTNWAQRQAQYERVLMHNWDAGRRGDFAEFLGQCYRIAYPQTEFDGRAALDYLRWARQGTVIEDDRDLARAMHLGRLSCAEFQLFVHGLPALSHEDLGFQVREQSPFQAYLRLMGAPVSDSYFRSRADAQWYLPSYGFDRFQQRRDQPDMSWMGLSLSETYSHRFQQHRDQPNMSWMGPPVFSSFERTRAGELMFRPQMPVAEHSLQEVSVPLRVLRNRFWKWSRTNVVRLGIAVMKLSPFYIQVRERSDSLLSLLLKQAAELRDLSENPELIQLLQYVRSVSSSSCVDEAKASITNPELEKAFLQGPLSEPVVDVAFLTKLKKSAGDKDSVECPLCLEVMIPSIHTDLETIQSDVHDNQLRILPCGHLCCEPCLLKLQIKSCPACRHVLFF